MSVNGYSSRAFDELFTRRARAVERRLHLDDVVRRGVLLTALDALGRRKRPARVVRALDEYAARPSYILRGAAATVALEAVLGRGEADAWALHLAVAPWRQRGEALRRRLGQDVRGLDAALDRLAPTTPVRPGHVRVVLRSTWVSTYASQGFGAEHYAEQDARAYADERRAALREGESVSVLVEPVLPDPSTTLRRSTRPYGWRVVALVESEADADVLRRRPGLGLVEWVADCWRRGTNPRVMYPWLPHGFEAQHGIGWDGSIKKGRG